MVWLKSNQRSFFVFILCIPFLLYAYFWNILDSAILIWFFILFFLFVIIPFSKTIVYRNGTLIQRIILMVAIFFLIYTTLNYIVFDPNINNMISIDLISPEENFKGALSFVLDIYLITISLIVFLNLSSKPLQLSPEYHPIISKYYILNVILIIMLIIAFLSFSNFERYYFIKISYISIILLIISSIIYKTKNSDK